MAEPSRTSRAIVLAALALTGICITAPLALGTPLVIQRMGDDIDISRADDGATLDTMGGDIHVNEAHGTLNLRSMGGNINVENAQGPVTASTAGGDITLHAVEGPTSLRTAGGTIRLTHAKGPVNASSAGGEIDAALTSSPTPRTIDLHSAGGDITLHLPHDFSGTFDITLDFTRNADERYRIVQNLGLAVTTTPNWEYHLGAPRKTIHAVGQVGSGRDHVTIASVNANISVLRD